MDSLANTLFRWHTVDAHTILPDAWDDSLLKIANRWSVDKVLRPTSVTSRESDDTESVAVSTVGGVTLCREASWLDALYRGLFREIAESIYQQRLYCAKDPRIGVNLNVQREGHRYEAHVDSNPVEGLLYVTSHPPGSGGELVVANTEGARGVRAIEQNATIVYPQSGHFVLFDARKHPHYVRPLAAPDGVRVVAAMNFYTVDCTEDDRPADLNRHLFGAD